MAVKSSGRGSERSITLFDSVGFAIEDFSALHYVRSKLRETGYYTELLADPDEPRDLFGMLLRLKQRLAIEVGHQRLVA